MVKLCQARVRIQFLALVTFATAILALCVRESRGDGGVTPEPSRVAACSEFEVYSASARHGKRFFLRPRWSQACVLPVNRPFLKHCQQLLSSGHDAQMARTLRLSQVALMPPPGSVVLFLTKDVGEDVPTLPPGVVSRQFQAAPDACIKLLALEALAVTSLVSLTGELQVEFRESATQCKEGASPRRVPSVLLCRIRILLKVGRRVLLLFLCSAPASHHPEVALEMVERRPSRGGCREEVLHRVVDKLC